jgi:hypothetical protein
MMLLGRSIHGELCRIVGQPARYFDPRSLYVSSWHIFLLPSLVCIYFYSRFDEEDLAIERIKHSMRLDFLTMRVCV